LSIALRSALTSLTNSVTFRLPGLASLPKKDLLVCWVSSAIWLTLFA